MPTNENPTDNSTGNPAPEAAPESKSAEQSSGQHDAGESQELSFEEMKAALASARRENAKNRVKMRELQPLAEKAREAEEANKTELEKAQEFIKQLQAEKAASERDAARAQIAAKFQVPAEMIVGDDDESMLESAQKIADFVEQKLKEEGSRRLPNLKSPGRESTDQDRDSFARQVLGI